MKVEKVIDWIAIAFSGSLVVVSLLFAYALVVPIDILHDWEIKVDQKTYHPREEITLHGSYKKLRDINGEAAYSLECKNPNSSYASYAISKASANRPAGSGKIDVTLRLPIIISNLPTKCRISVSIDYEVYRFRHFTEHQASNEFTVQEIKEIKL